MTFLSKDIAAPSDRVSIELIFNDYNWEIYLLSDGNRKKRMEIHHRHPLGFMVEKEKDSPEHCYCGEPIPKNLIIMRALHERT